MARLVWDTPTERHYESGLSHGVFYPFEKPGVVWNGLISIDETKDGNTREELFRDGIKFGEFFGGRSFQAKLSAFSAPEEFGNSVGEIAIRRGLIFTRQPRYRFGLSYRTEVSDTDYRIHLIYNALALPSKKSYGTFTGTRLPKTMEWTIDAVPRFDLPKRPTAHIYLDSRKIESSRMDQIQDLLYGSDSQPAALLLPGQLIDILND